MSFIFSYHAAVISYWCFVDDRLIEISYVETYGEGEARLLADVPPEVRSALDSLRPLRAEAAALGGPWATLTPATEPAARGTSITTQAGTIALNGSTAYLLDGAFVTTDLDPSGRWTPRFLTALGDGAAVLGSASGEAWPPRYAAWTTVDGRSWSGPAPIAFGESFTLGSVTTWDGRLVAVGGSKTAGGDSLTGEVWTSADALAWQRVPTPAVFDGTSLVDCHPGGDGVVVVAEGPSEAGVAGPRTEWTSADLTTWRRLGATVGAGS
jgi:hypothetical protein